MRLTRTLLGAGPVAGALLVFVSLVSALTRPGFQPARHANSQLALGDWGWLQTTNFIVSGLLIVAYAVGVWRALGFRRAGRVSAVGLGLYGVLAGVVAGLSPTDPMAGFPPGASMPAAPSTSAQVHSAASALGFVAVACACLAFARHFATVGRPGWRWSSLAAAAVVFAVSAYLGVSAAVTADSVNYLPVWFGGGALWVYLSAVAWRLRRDLS
ncbi:DUF998 domain-containing protein [Mycolicibacterium duvalii]|uniref:DUF998 domain-containing protein n=1 Tax=Mycolicibacterium duvalii TaxID=39688 RepID=A0A7I7K8E5_9MYCO|nr:DUF998 domain-containing protein [Mycolicibacterium duvalii]MCV7368127.1 DUF998 domain-containing protein [Mycolicibacterium duvalii]BBX19778.1 hypothetical protein MDUV_46380 [Mycolicibacterium duvalii]